MLERNAWIFRASLFDETKFPTLLGLKANGVQQCAAVNAPPVLFFKGAARCGSTNVVGNKHSRLIKRRFANKCALPKMQSTRKPAQLLGSGLNKLRNPACTKHFGIMQLRKRCHRRIA